MPEVERLNSNDIHHVLQEHHAWEKLVKDPRDWDAVARLISKTVKEGVEKCINPRDQVFQKSLQIGPEVIVVKYRKLANQTRKIGDSWIKSKNWKR